MSSIVRILGVAVLGMTAAGAAVAADTPLSNADPMRPPPPRADAEPPARPSSAPAVADSGARFILRDVAFEGASRPELLVHAADGFRGREVGAADLREIAARAEDAYDRAGLPYVSVRLAPQEVADGVVRFQVIEGRVTRLSVLGTDAVARRQAAGAFAPLRNGGPLTRDAVEAAYDEAHRIPGLVATAALGPAERPGDMDLVVQARRKPWSAYGSLSNLYPDSTGPWGASLGFEFAGGSPYGDALDVQLYSTLDAREQQAARIGYRRRLDAEGTHVALSALYARSEPGAPLVGFDYAADVWLARAEVWRPVIRGRGLRLEAGAAFDWIDQKSSTSASPTLADDHLRVVDLGLKGDWRGAPGRIDAEVHLRKGLDAAGASAPGDTHLSRPGADPQAWLVRGRIEGETRPVGPFTFYGRIEGQTTDDRLLIPEQYAAGNLTVGRGFDPGVLYTDRALGEVAEVRLGPASIGALGRLQPFAFYDRVELKNVGAIGSNTLESAGVGFRLEAPGRYRLTVTYADPNGRPAGLPEPSSRVLVDFTTSLDSFFGLLKGPRS